MKTKELAIIASKITGIAYILVAIGRLPSVFLQYIQFKQFMQHAPVDEMHSAITITAAVPEVSCALILIAGLFLLLQGDRIGGFISKDDTQVLPAIDAERFLGLGIAIVGIWVMAVSLPVVVEHVAYRVITKNMDIHVAQLARDKAALFGSCFKFAIGLWMFFGNSGLAGIRERMRGGR